MRLRRFRVCILSRLKPESESRQLFEQQEIREKEDENLQDVQPVWELKDEYLRNVALAEQQEQEQEQGALHDGDTSTKSWWL